MNHRFVDTMPEIISEGIIYVSLKYNVARHKCPCGCGDEIVTSISPDRWILIYNGDTISLHPSIGNWAHKCKSHYFIKNDEVVWLSKGDKNYISCDTANSKKTNKLKEVLLRLRQIHK